MNARLLIAAVALAAPFSANAAAQITRSAQQGSLDAEFQRSDTNHDGYLDRAEVQARMARMRAGTQPIDAVHARRMADLFIARADTNKDGRVSMAESQALLATVFSAFDRNHDGRIDPQEAAAARQAAARQAAAKPKN